MQLQCNPSEEDLQRLWLQIDKSGGPDLCWPWMGPTTRGYGWIRWNGRNRSVHRVVWELNCGTVLKDNVCVRHLCHNHLCCNPVHLVGDGVGRFWAKVDRANDPEACWKWIGDKIHDYGAMWWHGRVERAHRIAWEIANGPIPEGLNILHKCDNRACVNSRHLFVGTQAENMQDCSAKGRIVAPRGENHHLSKISAHDVMEIRQKYAQGINQPTLARQYGVTRGQIGHIVNYRCWKSVP